MGLTYGLILISPSTIWLSPVWRSLTGGDPPPWLPMPDNKPDTRGVTAADRDAMAAFIAKMDTIVPVKDRQIAYGCGKGSEEFLTAADKAGRKLYDNWVRNASKKWMVMKTINAILEEKSALPLDMCRQFDEYEVSNLTLAALTCADMSCRCHSTLR